VDQRLAGTYQSQLLVAGVQLAEPERLEVVPTKKPPEYDMLLEYTKEEWVVEVAPA